MTPPGQSQPLVLELPPYLVLDYCGASDPGHTIDIGPVQPNSADVLAHGGDAALALLVGGPAGAGCAPAETGSTIKIRSRQTIFVNGLYLILSSEAPACRAFPGNT